MLVYCYDEETKEFLYSEEAHIDPLETELKGENVYLLPANATFEKPLEAKEGFKVIFNGVDWFYEEISQPEPEPEPLPPTKEEQIAARQEAYKAEVDPVTCQIQRLGDEEQTPEVIAEIARLVEERKTKVAEIKARYPYPAEPVEEELAKDSNNGVVELYSMEI